MRGAAWNVGLTLDTVLIEVTKEGVKFSANGDVGKGMISLKQTTAVDKVSHHHMSIRLPN